MLSGTNKNKEINLVKPLTTLGKPGEQVAAVTRRPDGYFIAHVEGAKPLLVNGRSIGVEACPLSPADVIDLADVKMEFSLKNTA